MVFSGAADESVVAKTLLVKAVLIDADPRAGWAQALFGATPKSKRPRRRLFPKKPTAEAAPQPAEVSE